jgi:hypothetical protein
MFLFVANGKRPSNYRVILVLLGQFINLAELPRQFQYDKYEESVVVRIKSNLLLMIFWLHIINYNS